MNLMLDAVREDGQPPEEVWPYLPTLPVPLSTWKPPNNCVPIFRHEFARSITDVSKVFAALDADQPVLFTARITEQFYTPGNDNIIRSAPNDPETGNHALVAVGHGNTTNAQAVVLVRNSWGEDWADNGYAWVTKDYLEFRLLSIAVPFQ